jgi:hypothetical protein
MCACETVRTDAIAFQAVSSVEAILVFTFINTTSENNAKEQL